MRSLWRVLCWILEALAWALALGSAAAAVGANGGRWSAKLDLLTHPVMVWFVGGVAAFALSWFALSLWRGWTIRALAIVAVAAAGAIMAPDFTAPVDRAPANAPHQIKIIEFNAWGGRGNPATLVRWLNENDADIVIIVEANDDLEQLIRQNTGYFEKLSDGILVATRHPHLIERYNWAIHDIPGQGFSINFPQISGFDGGPFTVMGVHPGWPIPTSRRKLEDLHLVLALDHEDRPRTLMVGDFNSSPFSFRQRQADAAFGLERRDPVMPTWPARIPQLHGLWFPAPFMPIDHVYAGSLWRTIKVERGPRMGSDHYPLIATLAWTGPVGGDPKLWPSAH